jgi:gluconokinase
LLRIEEVHEFIGTPRNGVVECRGRKRSTSRDVVPWVSPPPLSRIESAMIVVLLGVAGSGKTTVGTMLADTMKCPFLYGDSMHPQENIEKMNQGVPLTDSDRGPWLSTIHARILDFFARDQDLVVGCSALKREYRDVLAHGVPIQWVHLKGSPGLIHARLIDRPGHFMKADMLASQFDSLEEPSDALVVDVSMPPSTIVEHILSQSGHTSRNSRFDN